MKYSESTKNEWYKFLYLILQPARELFMNKKKIERTIVVFLFIVVLVVFSFAERDSKKLERIYNSSAHSIKPVKVNEVASSTYFK